MTAPLPALDEAALREALADRLRLWDSDRAERIAETLLTGGPLPSLLSLVREQADVIDKARGLADEMSAQAEARGGKRYRPARTLWHFADRLRAVLPADHGQEERDE